MNTLVLLLLQESMAQRSKGEHDLWQWYMPLLVVNHGIIKSFSILTTVICQMIQCDVDKPQDCFRQEVKWMLVI
jgi:hypothetical protein